MSTLFNKNLNDQPIFNLLRKYDKKPPSTSESLVNNNNKGALSSSSNNSASFYKMFVKTEKVKRFSTSEATRIRDSLHHLQRSEHLVIQQTFNTFTFTLGVFNTLFAVFIFAGYPQHFWLLVMVEACILIPVKIYQDYINKPLCNSLYIIEYCWLMGFFIIATFIALTDLVPSVTDDMRRQMFMTTIGCGTGALLGASGVLPVVAFFFHDRLIMTSLFIHATPTFLLYTFLWKGKEIEKAWPGLFRFDIIQQVLDGPYFPPHRELLIPFKGLGTVSGNSCALYWSWMIVYLVWMFTYGLGLTSRVTRDGQPRVPKYDGAYQSFISNGFVEITGKYLWKRPLAVTRHQIATQNFELRDFFAYLVVHITSIIFATNVHGYISSRDQRYHAAYLWLLTVICIYRGAKKYVGMFTSFSDTLVEKHYQRLLEETKEA